MVTNTSRQTIQLSCQGCAYSTANARDSDGISWLPNAIKGVTSTNFLKLGFTWNSGLTQGCYVNLAEIKYPGDEG